MNQLPHYSLNNVIPSRIDGEGAREIIEGLREISRFARDDVAQPRSRKTNSEHL